MRHGGVLETTASSTIPKRAFTVLGAGLSVNTHPSAGSATAASA
jgi:hypothetical protein